MPMALAILDSRFFLADDDDKAEAWTPVNCNDWTRTWLTVDVSLFSSFVVGTLIPPQGADANRLAPSSRHALLMLSKRVVRSANAVSSVVILVVDAANAVSSVVILVVDAATVVSNVVTLVCSAANAVSSVLKRLKKTTVFVSVFDHSETKLKRKRIKIHSHYFACFGG